MSHYDMLLRRVRFAQIAETTADIVGNIGMGGYIVRSVDTG